MGIAGSDFVLLGGDNAFFRSVVVMDAVRLQLLCFAAVAHCNDAAVVFMKAGCPKCIIFGSAELLHAARQIRKTFETYVRDALFHQYVTFM